MSHLNSDRGERQPYYFYSFLQDYWWQVISIVLSILWVWLFDLPPWIFTVYLHQLLVARFLGKFIHFNRFYHLACGYLRIYELHSLWKSPCKWRRINDLGLALVPQWKVDTFLHRSFSFCDSLHLCYAYLWNNQSALRHTIFHWLKEKVKYLMVHFYWNLGNRIFQ